MLEEKNKELKEVVGLAETKTAVSNLTDKILNKIKEEHIFPKPRWHFLLKNYVVWLAGILALLIGAAAVSVMIYLFRFNDWEIYEETHKSLAEFILLTLPYFWIIFLALFVFIVYYNLKHTKSGYRYPLYIVILAPVSLSIFLGAVFFSFGWGEKIDSILGSQAPFYDIVINRHVDFWSQPGEGRLAGLIISEPIDSNFILLDRNQKEWTVVSEEKNFLAPAELVVIGQPVHLLGEVVGDNEFRTVRIMSARGGQGFLKHLDSCPGNCRSPKNFRPVPPNSSRPPVPPGNPRSSEQDSFESRPFEPRSFESHGNSSSSPKN